MPATHYGNNCTGVGMHRPQAWPAPTTRLSLIQATLPGFNYLSVLLSYPNHLHYFNSLIKESP